MGVSQFFKPAVTTSSEQKHNKVSSHPTDMPQPVDETGNSAAVNQVFSMFKDYLKKLDDKGNQIEQKSKNKKLHN